MRRATLLSSLCQTLVVAGIVFSSDGRADDCPAFRGANGDGISRETHVPLHWGPDKNILWKAPLPAPGNSSPVVSRGQVSVTCATNKGRKRGLYCFDRATGKMVWSKVVSYSEPDPTHYTN